MMVFYRVVCALNRTCYHNGGSLSLEGLEDKKRYTVSLQTDSALSVSHAQLSAKLLFSADQFLPLIPLSAFSISNACIHTFYNSF